MRYYCSKCDEDITKKEYDWSKENYGRILCRDCQPNRKGNARKSAEIGPKGGRGKYKWDVKKCMKCGSKVDNNKYDYCSNCFSKLRGDEKNSCSEDSFKEDLFDNRIYTVYVMFYGKKEKIGYTADLNSRMIEIRRKYPDNKLVYFREFVKESDARRFEVWLKDLSKRGLMKFISSFQDKIAKVVNI